MCNPSWVSEDFLSLTLLHSKPLAVSQIIIAEHLRDSVSSQVSVSTVAPHDSFSSHNDQHPNQIPLPAVEYPHLLMYIIIIIAAIRFPHFLHYYCRFSSRGEVSPRSICHQEEKYMERHLREISAL